MTIEETDLCRTQALIKHGIKDFSGAYMAVKYVAGHMDKHPDTIDVDTVKTLTETNQCSGLFTRYTGHVCDIRCHEPLSSQMEKMELYLFGITI